MLTSLDHPCVVGTGGSYLYTPARELWLCMEYLDGGDLYDASRFKVFNEDHVAYIAKQVCNFIQSTYS